MGFYTAATERAHPPGCSYPAVTSASVEPDPFGSLIASTEGTYIDSTGGNAFRFSTKYWDGETGLGYWGYRYARDGRWPNRDPFGEVGGPEWFSHQEGILLSLWDLEDSYRVAFDRISGLQSIGLPLTGASGSLYGLYLEERQDLRKDWFIRDTDILGRYTFVLNNPVNLHDPDGLFAAEIALADLCIPDPSDVFLPVKAVCYGVAIAAEAAIVYCAAEHVKNKRKSAKDKHEEGKTRKRKDKRGGEKGDSRRPY